jgi:hypothetical protein
MERLAFEEASGVPSGGNFEVFGGHGGHPWLCQRQGARSHGVTLIFTLRGAT